MDQLKGESLALLGVFKNAAAMLWPDSLADWLVSVLHLLLNVLNNTCIYHLVQSKNQVPTSIGSFSTFLIASPPTPRFVYLIQAVNASWRFLNKETYAAASGPWHWFSSASNAPIAEQMSTWPTLWALAAVTISTGHFLSAPCKIETLPPSSLVYPSHCSLSSSFIHSIYLYLTCYIFCLCIDLLSVSLLPTSYVECKFSQSRNVVCFANCFICST